ncbi:hypothetical protein GRI40_02575 [Altererythrobacter aerius]|uniref:Uncharacterized protein n=1 Tax=Tsuneonella aeria TaxID=1837929 RepID=A0A6I4TD31_9SPHN|nr:hypothetical protein [Tsuneonella aeria]MXO74105.1 hypothetical protein [Tsuneonella aeria]
MRRSFGLALFLSGDLWVLQGLGIVMWPAGSSMLADRSLALYGAITAIVGALMFVGGSARRHRG